MSETLQIVGGWRYLIQERDGRGLFAVVRRDIEQDILEDEVAFCYSEEVATVIASALISCERRGIGLCGESSRRNLFSR